MENGLAYINCLGKSSESTRASHLCLRYTPLYFSPPELPTQVLLTNLILPFLPGLLLLFNGILLNVLCKYFYMIFFPKIIHFFSTKFLFLPQFQVQISTAQAKPCIHCSSGEVMDWGFGIGIWNDWPMETCSIVQGTLPNILW